MHRRHCRRGTGGGLAAIVFLALAGIASAVLGAAALAGYVIGETAAARRLTLTGAAEAAMLGVRAGVAVTGAALAVLALWLLWTGVVGADFHPAVIFLACWTVACAVAATVYVRTR